MSDHGQTALAVDTARRPLDPADKPAAMASPQQFTPLEPIGPLDNPLDSPPMDDTGTANDLQDQLESLVTEFEQQREHWELQRRQELWRLRQEGTVLADAWQRLEDEQRRLFAEREKVRCGVPPTPASGRAVAASTAAAPKPVANPTHRPQPESSRQTAPGATTWWQLEQLRLEIQKHARRAT